VVCGSAGRNGVSGCGQNSYQLAIDARVIEANAAYRSVHYFTDFNFANGNDPRSSTNQWSTAGRFMILPADGSAFWAIQTSTGAKVEFKRQADCLTESNGQRQLEPEQLPAESVLIDQPRRECSQAQNFGSEAKRAICDCCANNTRAACWIPA
jgi:hypothetical protein